MNLDRFNFPLFEEFDDNSGGGSGGDFTPDTEALALYEGETLEGAEEDNFSGATDDNQQQQQQTATPQFTPDMIARAVAEGVRGVMPQQRQQQQAMSDEEFRRQTKYYTVQAEKFAKFFPVPEGADPKTYHTEIAQFFQEMVDGTAGHATSVANLLAQMQAQQVSERFAPAMSAFEKQQYDNFVSSITKLDPALKGHEKTAQMAMDALAKSGYRSQGAQKDRVAIAKATVQLIRQFNPQFKLRGSGGGNRARAGGMTGSVNGAGATGGRSGNTGKQPQSPGMALYATR